MTITEQHARTGGPPGRPLLCEPLEEEQINAIASRAAARVLAPAPPGVLSVEPSDSTRRRRTFVVLIAAGVVLALFTLGYLLAGRGGPEPTLVPVPSTSDAPTSVEPASTPPPLEPTTAPEGQPADPTDPPETSPADPPAVPPTPATATTSGGGQPAPSAPITTSRAPAPTSPPNGASKGGGGGNANGGGNGGGSGKKGK